MRQQNLSGEMGIVRTLVIIWIPAITFAQSQTYSGLFHSRPILRATWQPSHQATLNGFVSKLFCQKLCMKDSTYCLAYVFNETDQKCEWIENPFEVIYVSKDSNIDWVEAQIKPEAGMERIGIFGKQFDDPLVDKAFDYVPDNMDANPDLVLVPFNDEYKLTPHVMRYQDGIMYCGGAWQYNIVSGICLFTKIGRTSWEPISNLPQHHGQGASTVLGGIPFISGGLHAALLHAKTDLFINGSWVEGPLLPQSSHRHTIVAISNDEVLLLGMAVIPQYQALINTHVYNKVSNEWTPSGNLTMHRTDIGANVVEIEFGIKVVVAVGGRNTATDLVEIFYVNNKTWSVAPHRFPLEVGLGRVAVIEKTRLFYLGGVAANGTVMKAVFEYVHNGPWIRKHDMKEPMSDFGVISYNEFF